MYQNFFSSNSVDFQAAVLPICKKVGKHLEVLFNMKISHPLPL